MTYQDPEKQKALPDYVVIGVITKPHGIKGALKIRPLTDDPLRFQELSEVYLSLDDRRTLFEIEWTRVSNDHVVIKLKGVDDRSQAEHWRKFDVEIPRSLVRTLPKGEYYYFELLGLKAFLPDGTYLGLLQDIISNPGQDVYVISNAEQDKEVLVPAVPEWILDIDTEKGSITIADVPGLLE